MSEIIVSILNIFAMLCIIYFATILSARLSERKLKVGKKLWRCIVMLDRRQLKFERKDKVYLWCYLIIPALILHVLVIASQFRIGKMYIRPDLSFITFALLWVALPMFVIGIMNKNEKK